VRSSYLLFVFALSLATSGCPDCGEGGIQVSPSEAGAAAPDAASLDAARSDNGQADAGQLDAGQVDAAQADAARADVALDDAARPDAAQADVARPDAATPGSHECDGWQTSHPEWIFCDDFESTAPLVGDGRYFEYGDNDGDCAVVGGLGQGGSRGLRAIFQQGEVGAGGVKLGFGRNPVGYMNKGIRSGEDFREIWYRHYLKMEQGWQGNPAKLSRATVFAVPDWGQAMIAHLWSDGQERLLLDPASCVNGSGDVMCSGYNDFDNLDWLGNLSGVTAIFSTALSDTWFCIEHHVRLNDPGQSNGVTEFWIDGGLEARRDGLDFVGTYSDYGINAVFLENYWNSGSVQEQERYFDNFVVSTEPIGCL